MLKSAMEAPYFEQTKAAREQSELSSVCQHMNTKSIAPTPTGDYLECLDCGDQFSHPQTSKTCQHCKQWTPWDSLLNRGFCENKMIKDMILDCGSLSPVPDFGCNKWERKP